MRQAAADNRRPRQLLRLRAPDGPRRLLVLGRRRRRARRRALDQPTGPLPPVEPGERRRGATRFVSPATAPAAAAATTLGVIVLLGRVAAVVFLCSCLYGARFVRAWAAGGAKAQLRSDGVDGVSSSSRRFGDPVGVATQEECKKKVVMAGLLDRAGKTPSSRFGR